mmetsp:Transcript_25394/g.81508  ORF Transcript_25394/g.81508 Transcript_25394/m.81508 type:complete len:270 (-) Transcript_25394:257-1066(-)
MAESPSSGSSQRAAAMAALSASSDEIQVNARHVSSEQKAAEGEKALQSARQQAMAKLNRKGSTGVVSKSQGSSQHGQALAGLQGKLADKVGTGAKVVPNWKMTAAQKNAAAARAEIKGSGNHAAAKAMFGGGPKVISTGGGTPTSFVPVQKSPAGGAARKSPAAAATPPPPAAAVGSSVGSSTAEAQEGVEKDLALLLAAFPRLGTAEADGSISTTFGKVMDDEQLEQQLESLVGTLKAGRKRGLLQWEGQILLKGPHDAVPIKYVGQA